MPPPVVYVVLALAAAGVGYALYQIFKSDDTPVGRRGGGRQEEKKRENERRLVSPHQTDPSSSSGPATEMRDLRQSATQRSTSTSNSLPPSTGLRNRRSNANGRNAEDASGLIDGPNDGNIPFTPLAPESNPWASVQGSPLQNAGTSRSPFEDPVGSIPRPIVPSRLDDVLFDVSEASPVTTPTRSAFELGSESPTVASPSPRSDDLSLSDSHASSPRSSVAPPQVTLVPAQSPFEMEAGATTPRSASPGLSDIGRSDILKSSPPRIQLPTPSDSEGELEVVAPASPETHADLLEWTAVSSSMPHDEQPAAHSTSNDPTLHTLSPDIFAPPISRTATDLSTMSASFFTAQSPGTEFRSLPPTEPTSPFSDSLTFSGDEDMYSLPSHSGSDESLRAFSMPEEERHRADELMFMFGNANISAGGTQQEERHEDQGDSLSEASGYAGSSGGFSEESWSEFSAPPTSPQPRH